ncbi:MAG TPA: ATP-binding protein [Myxococcales bacterium]|nr:ATP-binding protein [Myxococcales bacterium]
MDIRSQSSLLAGVVSLALAVSMLLRPRLSRGRALTLFSLLCLSLSSWYLADFLSVFSGKPIWPRLGLAAGSIVPLAAIAFFTEFLGMEQRPARRAQEAALAGSLFGVAVAVTPLFRWPWVTAAVSLWAFGILGVTLWLLRGRERATASRLEQERLFYLLIGATIVVFLSALDFAARFGYPWPTLGSVCTTLYLFFLAQTVQRHRLLDLHELLGKVASVSALALMLALVYGVIGFWLKDRPGLFLYNTVIASFVILALYEPLRAKVEEQVLATLFRERFELIRSLTDLRARIATVVSPPQLASLVLEALHDSRRVTHTSFYLLAEDRPGFRLLDHRGPAPIAFLEAAAARGLLAAAAAGERAILLEVVERKLAEISTASTPGGPSADPEAARFESTKAALLQMCSGISFPLVAGDRVLGFWNLWDDRVPEAYSSDEIAAMLEVAERAAVVLESSQLFERMKERDRLAALGEMAAGLAHEIRNPLGAIKGAAQYLKPADLPGDDGDLLQVIVEEVNRLNGVVTEFLDYSRPVKSQLAPTDVNEVLQRTVKLLQSQGLPPGISIDLRLSPDLPAAQGDAEQLKQVFINLAFNAIQAMPRGGTLTIRTEGLAASSATWRFAEVGPSRARRSGPELLEVRFRDTGEGIPEDARERIFIPFYTTKAKGTGLGLAIVQRIVKAHNGAISVESQPGLGTEFVIRLPVAAETLTPLPVSRPLVATAAGAAVRSEPPPRRSPGTPELQPRPSRRHRRQRSR